MTDLDDLLRSDDPTQSHVRDWFERLGTDTWLELSISAANEAGRMGTFCALAPRSYRDEALSRPYWDLLRAHGGPGFMQQNDEAGNWVTRYLRLSSEPVEPLVIERVFHGVRPDYSELCEEFRLVHNLYHDRGTGNLVTFDSSGNESVAAKIGEQVAALTDLVRRYQATRQLDLLLFIDSVVHYDPKLDVPKEETWSTTTMNAVLFVGDVDGRPFTHLMATRVLPPPPIEQSGIWPYEPVDDHFPDFVIGTDDSGGTRRFTCDPSKLANYFGANPDAPNYLTPVHFRRDVLVKYYDRPDLYTVEDGYLRCAGLWGLRMDNDGAEAVVVWLGDLGRDLPPTERDYWRSFNVAPSGDISETAYRRAILGQFADAESSDLQFRIFYGKAREAFSSAFGWPLFRDPEPGDAHVLNSVRRPLHDTDTEFEQLVRSLTLLLVDFLNEAELDAHLPPGPEGEKGIGKFQRWLTEVGYGEVQRDVSFLRNLQTLRSKGVAHRKGSDYEETLDRILGDKRRANAGNALLDSAVRLLRTFAEFAVTKNLSASDSEAGEPEI